VAVVSRMQLVNSHFMALAGPNFRHLAPDTPPIEVKKGMQKATTGGMRGG
jgi:hypothetical protein